ncbi:hypothetical protein [Vibrio alginolyticus]|uniref:hypothetical protein n=1 Tax=Vibrio alginolyticus TaxID=663 RepID=UPI0006CA6663|nr:hypothetical protein [Vibrio alginolyticus]KPM97519.1 hypothetical protein AOG25_13690 [Vibrio alginolyticus]CAH7193479.1 conserved hypothetical protein [Vibrio chagasii]CAH7361263.1 conserved hypothetical protein [Vibrio chagasii]
MNKGLSRYKRNRSSELRFNGYLKPLGLIMLDMKSATIIDDLDYDSEFSECCYCKTPKKGTFTKTSWQGEVDYFVCGKCYKKNKYNNVLYRYIP